MLAAGETKPHR